MPVRFFYVDESYDRDKYCLSALGIRHSVWKECFELVREHRVNLKRDYGIYLRKEIHARDLVHGSGRISLSPIGKWQRSRIFLGMLKLAASLPDAMLFNICLDRSSHADPQMVAWDRLMNRIERTMLEFERNESPLRRALSASASPHLSVSENAQLDLRLNIYRSRAAIFADEGREFEITRALRKMHVFNPIPSKLGGWPSGSYTKSITIDRVIEDPTFKRSDRSYLIQLTDCIAFALLKREVIPTPLIAKYKIEEMFDDTVAAICYRKASGDPLGIVRY